MVSLSWLAACAAGSLQELRDLDPQANDFQSALAAEYLAYANDEAERGRELSADYFAKKGLKATRGETVDMETVEASVPNPLQNHLKATRAVLTALLSNDSKRIVPQDAARAQLLFDCWVNQAAKLQKSSSPCADELEPALSTLQSVAGSLALGNETTHLISFEHGSAELSEDAQNVIKTVADYVKTSTQYTIELNGFTSTKAAKKLLQKRAEIIRKELRGYDIDDGHIRIRPAVSGAKKAVYLSDDETIKNPNQIAISIKIFDKKPGQP